MSKAEEQHPQIPEWFWQDLQWLHEHAGELDRDYEEEWVAAVDKKIVAHGRPLKKVLAEAARETGRDPEDIPVLFVVSPEVMYGQIVVSDGLPNLAFRLPEESDSPDGNSSFPQGERRVDPAAGWYH